MQGEYVSCLLSLLQQMTEIHFHHLLNNFHSKEELKVGRWPTHHPRPAPAASLSATPDFFFFFFQEFLLKIFCVFRNLMKLTIFPRDWSVMRLLTSQ